MWSKSRSLLGLGSVFEVHAQWVIWLGVCMLPILVYLPSIDGEFIWDDWLLVKENPFIIRQDSFGKIFLNHEFPLSVLLLGVQYKLWGEHTIGYHVLNFALHTVNATLVWLIGKRLRLGKAALLGAAAWLLHPLCVATVAWISEFKNVLSGFFGGLSVYFFLCAATANPIILRSRISWNYSLSLLCFAIGLLAKTSIVMLPICMGIYVWTQSLHVRKSFSWRLVPYFVVSALMGFRTIALYKAGIAQGLCTVEEGLGVRLLAAGDALWFYITKALVPIGLCAEYPTCAYSEGTLLSLMPGVAWIVLLGLLFILKNKMELTPFGGLAFFTINLLPVLGIIPMPFQVVSRVSDHFVYVPLVGVCLVIGWLLERLLSGWILRLGFGLLILAYCVISHARARVYASEQRFWQDTVLKNPLAWNAHNNLGCALAQAGLFDQAKVHFEKSLAINPTNAEAHCNLARIFIQKGQVDEAIEHFRKAVALRPKNASIREVFGATLLELGRLREASEQLEHALRLGPNGKRTWLLAQAKYQLGEFSEAINLLERAIAMDPDDVDLLHGFALILLTCPDTSFRDYIKAATLAKVAAGKTDYTNVTILSTLVRALAAAGDISNACVFSEKALRLAEQSGDEKTARWHGEFLRRHMPGKSYFPGYNPVELKQ